MKTIRLICLAMIFALVLAGCGGSDSGSTASESHTSDSKTESQTQGTDSGASQGTDSGASQGMTAIGPIPTQLSKTYADMEGMSFIYNGHLVVLGVTTFGELVDYGADFCDDGYPIPESEKPDINQIMKADYMETFDILIAGNKFFWADVANVTDQDMPQKDCPITAINMWVEGEMPDNMKFAFPFDLTKEQLVENSGEPTEISGDENYCHYDYQAYLEHSPYGYVFDFENGILAGVSMYYPK